MAAPLTDEEMDAIAEKLLAKLFDGLARRARNDARAQPEPEPGPEAYANVLARQRRRMQRR